MTGVAEVPEAPDVNNLATNSQLQKVSPVRKGSKEEPTNAVIPGPTVCKITDPSAEDRTQMEFKVALSRVEMRAESGWPPPALISISMYIQAEGGIVSSPEKVECNIYPSGEGNCDSRGKVLPKRTSIA
jgi:hypothetical protein